MKYSYIHINIHKKSTSDGKKGKTSTSLMLISYVNEARSGDPFVGINFYTLASSVCSIYMRHAT